MLIYAVMFLFPICRWNVEAQEELALLTQNMLLQHCAYHLQTDAF